MPASPTRSLFSQHFLERRLPDETDWQVDVDDVFANLKELYQEKKDFLATLNEAQTEQEFIRPVLDALGFAYIPQTSFKKAGQVQRPDYALFDKESKKRAQKVLKDERAFYSDALAILDAKYWARPLSEQRKNDARDEFKNANPTFQMVNYLIGTGVDWGILTNGETWRLYYRLASSTATEFYQVNLVQLLEQDDAEQFKYFYLFFRREAFERDAQGKSFLERVREGSLTYARIIGDQLKDLVYEQVFPLLAGGFIAQRHGKGVTENEETKREIYQATMSLLYKLLFLFYAEARSLLPVNHAGYRDNSLTTMARNVAARIDKGTPLGETSTRLYGELLNLFEVIDRGERQYQLPRYNGGLFSPKSSENQFIAANKLNDEMLGRALDVLWRTDGEPIDYGFIDVRTLGSIYEGLLEYKLHIKNASKGSVELKTDKKERKETGSYYTPDYVVKYIVHETLAPILAQREKQFADAVEKYHTLLAKKHATKSLDVTRVLNRQIEDAERAANEILLDIKVCDPAMGSGHFLVETVDYLTDGIIRILNQFPQDNPLLKMLEQIRKTIVSEMAQQGIEVDVARLDDTSLLQRVVMKRCIYGVDYNTMAVELAKVSLWLHTFTVGAPLSFLDHHLRFGNSLLGAFARRVQNEFKADAPLLGSPFEGILNAAKTMQEISLSSDATIADVEHSANLFDVFEQAVVPYKRLLDIYLMPYYGSKRADEFLRLYGPDALTTPLDKISPPYRKVFEERETMYADKRFFHWDLEFPEVFIDLHRTVWKENFGFDAVVGNPPYVDVKTDAYYDEFYETASARNLYSYMLERARMIGASSSRLGMIVPMSLVCSERMKPLRDSFTKNYAQVRVANFGIRPAKIFPNVDQRTTIVVAQEKTFEVSETSKVLKLEATRLHRWHEGQEQAMIAKLSFADISDLPAEYGWAKLGDETGRSIALKLFKQEKTIGDYLTGDWKFWFHGIGRYWLKAYAFEPTFLDADGKPRHSTTLGELNAQNEEIGKVIIAIVNSSLFFWYWILYGDEFHLMEQEIKSFPFTYHKGSSALYKKLGKLVDELMDDYHKHSTLQRTKYATGEITQQIFYPRHSKPILDRIDDLLGSLYGLTREQVEYVKSYDGKFRMDED